MARKEANKLLGQIAMGIDPIAEKRTERMRALTLNDVFDDYLKARKSLKQTTITNYNQILQKAFPNWRSKPLVSITNE